MSYVTPEKRKEYNDRYYEKKRRLKGREQRRAGQDEKMVPFNTRQPISMVGRLHRMKDEAIATGRYPWRTTSDLVYALLVRGLETFDGDDWIEEILPFLKAREYMRMVVNQRQEAQALLSSARVEITELLRIKAERAATHHFHNVMELLHKIEKSEWRDWAIGELKKAFPRLLVTKLKRVSLELEDAVEDEYEAPIEGADEDGTPKRHTSSRRDDRQDEEAEDEPRERPMRQARRAHTRRAER